MSAMDRIRTNGEVAAELFGGGRSLRRVIALVVVVYLGWTWSQTTLLTPIPGTDVSLDVPSPFALDDGFPGISHVDSGSSIVVLEIPGPVSEVTSGMTAAGLAGQGMELIDRKSVTLSGQDAILLTVRQSASGFTFMKWIVAIGDDRTTILLNASTLEDNAATFGPVLQDILLSAVWNPSGSGDPFAGHDFRFDESDSFRIAESASTSLVLLLTEGGAFPVAEGDPFIVVAPSVGSVLIDDIAGFSKLRLLQTATLTDIAIQDERELQIAGLPAYEILARARQDTSVLERFVYQMLIWDVQEGGYFLITGLAPQSQADRYLPEFRSVAMSFRKVDQ